MRFIAALLLGGLFSAMVPSCLARETPLGDPPPLPEGTVLPYLNPLQTCLDACFLSSKLCDNPTDWCITWCGDDFRLAGPECQEEFAMRYACELARYQAQVAANMPECPQYLRCFPKALYDCVWEHGCTWADCGPAEPDGCWCAEHCLQAEYKSSCLPNGMTTTCDCFVNRVLVGTCDGGTELFCDMDLTKGCCNQYFKLEF